MRDGRLATGLVRNVYGFPECGQGIVRVFLLVVCGIRMPSKGGPGEFKQYEMPCCQLCFDPDRRLLAKLAFVFAGMKVSQ